MPILVPIEGYEGRYLISDDGNVYSVRPEGERLLKQQFGGPYPTISLTHPKTRKGKIWRVHSLVARHFVPGYRPDLEVNHKNGIKTDNRAENLEWVTPKENMAHARRIGLRDNYGLSGVPVIATNLLTGEETVYRSQVEAAKGTGAYRPLISHCCLGKIRKTANHAFRFLDPDRAARVKNGKKNLPLECNFYNRFERVT